MMQVDIHDPTSNLSNLVKQAMIGVEIVLEEKGQPVAKIIPVLPYKNETFQFGVIPGLKIKENFDAPLPEDIAVPFGK